MWITGVLASSRSVGAAFANLNEPVGARRAAVESRRNAIRRLVTDWNEVLTTSAPELAVDVISDQSQIGNVLMHYADRCRNELLSVAPGRLPKTRMDSRTRIANLYSARRGIKTRALYQHAALRDRHTRSYLAEMAENGAKIRFAASVPGRSLVIDRVVALLSIPTDDPVRIALAVLRPPHAIACTIATFAPHSAAALPVLVFILNTNRHIPAPPNSVRHLRRTGSRV